MRAAASLCSRFAAVAAAACAAVPVIAKMRRMTALHVFSRKPADDEPRHPELARLRAEVETLPNSSTLDPWAELFAPDSLGSSRAVSLALLERAIEELRGFGLTRLPRLVAEALYVRRRAQELDLGHLHAHFATDSAVVAMLAHQLGGPPYSITAHAKDIYRDTVDRGLLARLIEGSAFTVTVCDANIAHLERLLPASALGRVRRLYNGLNLDDFRFHDGARDEDHVLSIGRLVAKKGFDVLIDAHVRPPSGRRSRGAGARSAPPSSAAARTRSSSCAARTRPASAGA